MYDLNHFETYEELAAAVKDFIRYYNHQHKLNCLPPEAYWKLQKENQDPISEILEKVFCFFAGRMRSA